MFRFQQLASDNRPRLHRLAGQQHEAFRQVLPIDADPLSAARVDDKFRRRMIFRKLHA